MRVKIKYTFLALIISVGLATLPGCSKKTGCPMNENVHTKTDKKGNLSTKGGKTNLFPKNMRRR